MEALQNISPGEEEENNKKKEPTTVQNADCILPNDPLSVRTPQHASTCLHRGAFFFKSAAYKNIVCLPCWQFIPSYRKLGGAKCQEAPSHNRVNSLFCLEGQVGLFCVLAYHHYPHICRRSHVELDIFPLIMHFPMFGTNRLQD